MYIKSVALIDSGQDFNFTLPGKSYRGRRYTAGSIIDLDQFINFDPQTNTLEYYFQNFLSPVDTIDVRDIISPLAIAVWNDQRSGFGIVNSDLWLLFELP